MADVSRNSYLLSTPRSPTLGSPSPPSSGGEGIPSQYFEPKSKASADLHAYLSQFVNDGGDIHITRTNNYEIENSTDSNGLNISDQLTSDVINMSQDASRLEQYVEASFELAELNEHATELEKENLELKQQLEFYKTQSQSSSISVEKYKELELENNRLKDELASKSFNGSTIFNQSGFTNLDELVTSFEKATRENDLLLDRVKELENENEALKKENNDAVEAFNQLQEAHEKLEEIEAKYNSFELVANETIQSLNDKLDDANDEIEELKATNMARDATRIKDLQMKVKTYEKNIQNLENKHTEVIGNLNSTIISLNTEVTTLKKQLEETTDDNIKLHTENTDLQRKLGENEAKLKQNSDELNHNNAMNEKIQKIIVDSNAQITQLKEVISKYEAEKLEYTQKISILNNEKEHFENELSEIKKGLVHNDQKNEDLISQINLLTIQLSSKEKEIETERINSIKSTSNYMELKQKYDKLKNESDERIFNLEDDINSLQSDIADLTKTNNSIKEELGVAKVQYNNYFQQVQSLQTTNTDLKEEIKLLKKDNAAMTSKLDNSIFNKPVLQPETPPAPKVNMEATLLRHQLTAAQERIEKLTSLEAANTELQETISSLTNENDRLSERNKELERKEVELSSALDQLRSIRRVNEASSPVVKQNDLDKLMEQTEFMNQELDNLRSENASLSGEIESLKRTNEWHKTQQARYEATKASLIREREDMRVRCDSLTKSETILKQRIREAEGDLKGVREDLDAARITVTTLQGENEYLTKQKEAFKAQAKELSSKVSGRVIAEDALKQLRDVTLESIKNMSEQLEKEHNEFMSKINF